MINNELKGLNCFFTFSACDSRFTFAESEQQESQT